MPMPRRFRRRPPLWLWLVLGVAVALAGRSWLDRLDEVPTVLAGEAVVLSIIDGQTLEVAVQDEARKATRVRLLGIRVVDGASAHQWLASNLVHQTVRIKLDKRRRATDGAHLAYVYLGPIFVNAEMISRGWARHEPYPGDSARHASLMREATGK
jgi:endonuclease YncB( thermonuclease family)